MTYFSFPRPPELAVRFRPERAWLHGISTRKLAVPRRAPTHVKGLLLCLVLLASYQSLLLHGCVLLLRIEHPCVLRVVFLLRCY